MVSHSLVHCLSKADLYLLHSVCTIHFYMLSLGRRLCVCVSLAPVAHPTERQLFHHVARNLGADWKRFAIYLGFEDARIQQADSMQSLEHKAFDILVAWRKGPGNKPKSWATILAALETAELNELACEIVGHIEGGTLYCSTPQVK